MNKVIVNLSQYQSPPVLPLSPPATTSQAKTTTIQIPIPPVSST